MPTQVGLVLCFQDRLGAVCWSVALGLHAHATLRLSGPGKGRWVKPKEVNLYCRHPRNFTTPFPTQHILSSSTSTFYTSQGSTQGPCSNMYHCCRVSCTSQPPLRTQHLNALASWMSPCSKDSGFQWNANCSIGLRCCRRVS